MNTETAAKVYIAKCGTCGTINRTESYRAKKAVFCACGGGGKAHAAKVSKVACDVRCTSAVSPVCSCSCEGRFHGVDSH